MWSRLLDDRVYAGDSKPRQRLSIINAEVFCARDTGSSCVWFVVSVRLHDKSAWTTTSFSSIFSLRLGAGISRTLHYRTPGRIMVKRSGFHPSVRAFSEIRCDRDRKQSERIFIRQTIIYFTPIVRCRSQCDVNTRSVKIKTLTVRGAKLKHPYRCFYFEK